MGICWLICMQVTLLSLPCVLCKPVCACIDTTMVLGDESRLRVDELGLTVLASRLTASLII